MSLLFSDSSFETYLEKTPAGLLFHSMINRALQSLICFGITILCLSFVIAHPDSRAVIWVMPMTVAPIAMFLWRGSQAVDILQKLLDKK